METFLWFKCCYTFQLQLCRLLQQEENDIWLPTGLWWTTFSGKNSAFATALTGEISPLLPLEGGRYSVQFNKVSVWDTLVIVRCIKTCVGNAFTLQAKHSGRKLVQHLHLSTFQYRVPIWILINPFTLHWKGQWTRMPDVTSEWLIVWYIKWVMLWSSSKCKGLKTVSDLSVLFRAVKICLKSASLAKIM